MTVRGYWKRYIPENSIKKSDGSLVSSVNFQLKTGKNDATKWANRSFFVIKDSLSKGNNTLIDDNATCRCWNSPASLFSSCRLKINGATQQNITDYAQVDSMLKRMKFSNDYLETIGSFMNLDSEEKRVIRSANYITEDCIYVPNAIALWQIDTLKPSTDIRIEFDVSPNYLTRVVKSDADQTVLATTSSSSNFRYVVESIELWVWTEEGAEDYPANLTYEYDLIEFNAQPKNLSSSSAVNEQIKVEPSVTSFAFAFQNNTVDSDTRTPPTEFKFDSAWENMTNQYIVYNGMNYLQSTNPMVNDDGVERSGYLLSAYLNLLQNGQLLNEAGYESFDNYLNVYGPYWFYKLTNDSSVMATNVDVRINFKVAQTCRLFTFSANTFKLTVTYDSAGNMLSCVKVIV